MRASLLRVFKLGSITLGVLFVGLLVASFLPTCTTRLASEYPPLEDRTARAPSNGCTLTEQATVTGCKEVNPIGVKREEVTFRSSIPDKGLVELKGTLTLPTFGNGARVRRPAVILLHGSGPNDRHERVPGDLVSKVTPPVAVFDELAEILARAGFVVLAWDKRSCLRCYPSFHPSALARFRFGDYVTDARDAIAYLETRPEVLPGAIVVAGHSEGGQLAPFVAEGDGRVRAVVMLAGLTERFDRALVAQLDRLRDIRLRQADLLGAMGVAWTSSRYAKCFAKLDVEYDSRDACTGGGVTLEMLSDVIAMIERTPDVLARLTCPLFAIQGSVDRNIDPTEMHKLRPLLAGKDFELHYVAGVNHVLVDVAAPGPPRVSGEVARRLLTFLGSVSLTE